MKWENFVVGNTEGQTVMRCLVTGTCRWEDRRDQGEDFGLAELVDIAHRHCDDSHPSVVDVDLP